MNSDNDLDIQGGDLVVGESTQQNQKLILQSNPGEWRAAPLVGVGIQNMIEDDAPSAAISSSIQAQFEADGMEVDHINLSGATLDVAAYYRDAND
ncbi:oxidase [Hymenobacter sp. BT664]|uniref:Oxidase n=1 Tax=Hymenobacter montanus TaxID=2771359 RepID=A0A927BFX1_9BACT|nr:oxidase [Hymenobacter montanus]